MTITILAIPSRQQ